MDTIFKPRYFKDQGGPLPPGFWIGIMLVAVLFIWLHGCKGGVTT